MIRSVLAAVGLALASPASPATLLETAGVARPAIETGDAVLIIIDAQEEYRSGGVPLEGFDDALVKIERLRRWAHRHDVPVIHVQHLAAPAAKLFARGSTHSEIVKELTPLATEQRVVKGLPNSFAGTNLAALLDATGRRTLILSGYMTHMCVEATARAALDHDYTAFVVSDATATRDLPSVDGGVIRANDVQSVALASIADRFGWVLKTNELIEAAGQ